MRYEIITSDYSFETHEGQYIYDTDNLVVYGINDLKEKLISAKQNHIIIKTIYKVYADASCVDITERFNNNKYMYIRKEG